MAILPDNGSGTRGAPFIDHVTKFGEQPRHVPRARHVLCGRVAKPADTVAPVAAADAPRDKVRRVQMFVEPIQLAAKLVRLPTGDGIVPLHVISHAKEAGRAARPRTDLGRFKSDVHGKIAGGCPAFLFFLICKRRRPGGQGRASAYEWTKKNMAVILEDVMHRIARARGPLNPVVPAAGVM
jgi:hypothetical protein